MNVKQEKEKRSMVEHQTSNWSWQTGREDNVKEQRRRPTTHRISRVPRTHATSQTVETFLSGLLLDPVSYRLGRKEHSAGKKWKVPEVGVYQNKQNKRVKKIVAPQNLQI